MRFLRPALGFCSKSAFSRVQGFSALVSVRRLSSVNHRDNTIELAKWFKTNEEAITAYRKGDLAKAEEMLNIALELRRPFRDVCFGVSMANIGSVYRVQGKLDIARESLEESIDILEELATEKQRATLVKAHVELGTVHQDMKLFKEAIQNFQAAEKLIEHMAKSQIVSPEMSSRSYFLHAKTLHLMGELLLAKEKYIKSLAFSREAFGDKHWNVAETCRSIGALLGTLGEFEEGSEYYIEWLSIVKELDERYVLEAISEYVEFLRMAKGSASGELLADEILSSLGMNKN